jgi:hypothetical protein
VREWWRSSRSKNSDEEDRSLEYDETKSFSDMLTTGIQKQISKVRDSIAYGEFPRQAELQSSVAAAILMSSPSMMINFALGAFLTGIGVYLGFVWKNDLDTLASKTESRNVFICFLISLAFCYSFYVFPLLSKLWEDYQSYDKRQPEIAQHFTKVEGLLDLASDIVDIIALDFSRQKMLISFLKIIAMGGRSPNYQSSLEAVRVAEDIQNLLDKWVDEDIKEMKGVGDMSPEAEQTRLSKLVQMRASRWEIKETGRVIRDMEEMTEV